MPAFEYKVVPAPSKGAKVKGLRSTQDRFAHALEQVMNDLGAQGWEYQRTDSLPCEEREGLIGKTTQFQHMLVFRRPLTEAADRPAPPLLEDHSADPIDDHNDGHTVAAKGDQPADTKTAGISADTPAAAPVPVPQPQPQPKVAAE